MKKTFTIYEIVVVIFVIGVLSAVAVPRLNTDKLQLVGVGEAWTPSQAARVALDKIERQIILMKELEEKHPYAEEVLNRLVGEL